MNLSWSFILIHLGSISLNLVCLAAGWILIFLLIRNAWIISQDGIAYVKRLHQIPCHRCAFFTGDYRLKCTVNPYKALTEDAIACLDYEPTNQSPSCPCQSRMAEVFQKELRSSSS
jgi:hypothetical protein